MDEVSVWWVLNRNPCNNAGLAIFYSVKSHCRDISFYESSYFWCNT